MQRNINFHRPTVLSPIPCNCDVRFLRVSTYSAAARSAKETTLNRIGKPPVTYFATLNSYPS